MNNDSYIFIICLKNLMKNVNVFVATFLYTCNSIFTYIIIKKNYILYIFKLKLIISL